MTNFEAIVYAPLALWVLRRNVRRAERLIADLMRLGASEEQLVRAYGVLATWKEGLADVMIERAEAVA